ncbi:MAG: hypothetical protein PWQ20_858 [Thermotogaceae bacterium]|nr:hypothetical protein [Thermotogaceae bacterium]
MKKAKFKLSILLSIVALVFMLFGCGPVEIWIGVDIPLTVIEISLVDSISLSPSFVLLETGEKFKVYDSIIHIALSDEAKNDIGNRQITDIEISIDASLNSTYSSPVHVELYLTETPVSTSEDLSTQDLVWEGDVESGTVISETLNLSNSPGLQHVINILNSSNREGDLYVAVIHDYPETDPATVTFDITVTRLKVTLF